jgi:hypothetical protein
VHEQRVRGQPAVDRGDPDRERDEPEDSEPVKTNSARRQLTPDRRRAPVLSAVIACNLVRMESRYAKHRIWTVRDMGSW